MNNSRIKILIFGGVAILIILIMALYLLFFTHKSKIPSQTPSSPPSSYPASYPQSVKDAISNPVDKVGDWNTLVNSDNFQISYSTSQQGNSFFITINAQPVVQVTQQAEQAFLQKLGISKDYACTLPVIVSIPAKVDETLSGYNFGLSFCPGQRSFIRYTN